MPFNMDAAWRGFYACCFETIRTYLQLVYWAGNWDRSSMRMDEDGWGWMCRLFVCWFLSSWLTDLNGMHVHAITHAPLQISLQYDAYRAHTNCEPINCKLGLHLRHSRFLHECVPRWLKALPRIRLYCLRDLEQTEGGEKERCRIHHGNEWKCRWKTWLLSER